MSTNHAAVLSSFNNYTTFSFNGTVLTFRTCSNLDRYIKIINWDSGYIEVLARYRHMPDDIEEYIDLKPMLKNLYMDSDSFLGSIKEVKIEYV